MRDSAYAHVIPIENTRKRFVVPPFALASSWSGVSQMLARFGIGNTNPFTLKRPIEQPNETFVAAVAWNQSPYVYRYKITKDIGEVLYFPLLNNQQIGVGAYIEIWSVADEVLASIDEEWELQTSKLVLPNLCSCVETLESETGLLDVPSELPPNQYCNPFCFPLCGFSGGPIIPGPTTFSLYYGVSTSPTLTESGILNLNAVNNVTTPSGTYNFGANSPAKYLYFAWPNAEDDQPIAGTGFTSSGFPVALAGAGQGYANAENGWNFTIVVVNGISYRLYRTYYPLTLGLSIIINAS